ncbi:4-hydroxy-tetrahydrodipicolinate reductase [Candidatus Peregrinibacteria bacterium]|nr:4-hydroxy-tetrahydrodipicolinate reductase [Candidatus Peregrinibacteria bacterium]
MKIALIGFGGMGKTVHRIAVERGHSVPVIVDPKASEATFQELSAEVLQGMDMVIDFSLGSAVLENAKICRDAGVNLVIGTTGWYDKMEEVRAVVEGGAAGGTEMETQPAVGFLWSSNFSIGVNMYFKIVQEAAKLVNRFDEYDVWGHEIHHYNKADSPSGTAKTLEKILLSNIERKTAVVEEKLSRRREPNEIHFSSVRGGAVNFAHTIGLDSEADTITISHAARNRDGYALGAVKAAEWLYGKKGFFGMEDFLKFN